MSFLFRSDERARARLDRWLFALAVILAVALAARAVRKEDGVLVRNQEFGARFLSGEDPYLDPELGERVHGPYPPSYALVTVPLSLLPTRVARSAWALAQIGALGACFVVLRRWTRRGWPASERHAGAVFALALALDSRFILRDMAGGGGNLLYATSALWGLEMLFRRRDLAAGLLVALPLCIKPSLAPIVLFVVGYGAARGRWKALLATIAFAALLGTAPALMRGASDYAALFERWFRDVLAFARAEILEDVREIPLGMPLADTTMNQSLREALWRLVDPRTAAWTARALGSALLAWAGLVALRARGARSEILAALAFLPVCLLVSPIAWKAHHALLLPLFFVLILAAREGRRSWLRTLLVLYYGVCVLLSEELVGKDWKERLQEVSVVTWGALALFAAAIAIERQERDARQPPPPTCRRTNLAPWKAR